MKARFFLLSLLVCYPLTFIACDDDDNYTPEDVVLNTFNSMYPDAKRVEWETKAAYKVADFHFNSKEMEAWFEANGKWVMTETDILFDELPSTVQDSFKSSMYATWRVEDVDKLERSETEVIYIIEVEEGKNEFDLYYTEDGTLIKEVNDNDQNGYEPITLPSSVTEKINEMYPGAKILEFEREHSNLEVDILDGRIHKDVIFNDKNEWLYTEWEIRTSDVPEVVMTALKTTEYANYKIDDIDVFEKPDGLFYVFELESGNKEVHLTIKADGTIVNT